MTSVKRTLLAIALGASTLGAVVAPANAHPAVRSDAVSVWNAHAGEAAIAACLAPTAHDHELNSVPRERAEQLGLLGGQWAHV